MSTRRDVLTGGAAHRTQGDTNARRSAERQQAYDLRLRGRTLRQIATDMGCSADKVHKLIREEIKLREDPFIHQVRQFEQDRLDHLQQVALTLLDNPGTVQHVAHWDGTYETNDQGEQFKKITMVPVLVLDDRKISAGIDRVLRICESRRKLLGVDAPVRVSADVQVTETTQEDLEAQELVREAKARAAAAEAKIKAMRPDREA